MKTLLVLRHAKACPESPSGGDFDRPLNDRGIRDSLAVGRQLRSSIRRVDALIASPAARVAETVASVLEGARSALPPLWDRRLYNASVDTLIEALSEIDDGVGTAMIVAHNPGLRDLITHLADADGAGLHEQISLSFPTAALAELQLSIERWRDAGPGCGRIQSFVRPGDREEAPVRPE